MSKVPDNKNFDNKYDNADLQQDRTTKDLAVAFTQFDEMRAYKMYIETLEAEARIAESDKTISTSVRGADGRLVKKTVPVKDLVPQASEFEQARRRIIVKLNELYSSKPNEIKQLFAEFETESLFELSSKITNYLLDKSRRDRVANEFNLSSIGS